MKTVLCIEAGAFGAGSAESLFTHINSLKEKYNFICIFTAQNKFSEKIESLGVKVYYTSDNFFNLNYMKKHNIISRIYNLFYKLTFSSFFSLHKQIINLFNKSYFQFIEDVIQKNTIDIIHTNNQPNRDFYIFEIAQKYNIKVVSHIRSFNTYGFSKDKADFCNSIIDKYVSYSTFLRQEWGKEGLDTNKFAVIPNSVIELTEEELAIANEKVPMLEDYTDNIKLAIIGRMVPERGYLFAIKVLKELVERNKRIKLFIVGNHYFDNYYKELQQEIINLDLSDHIVFTGFVDKPAQFLKNIDILFMPYDFEPFGRILLEAWQLKVPVVLSDVGNIRDVVADKENGVIYHSQNISDCVNSIEYIIHNQGLVDKMVENGYNTYKENYTPRSYVNKMLKVYEEVLQK